jgi:hypothetical protein
MKAPGKSHKQESRVHARLSIFQRWRLRVFGEFRPLLVEDRSVRQKPGHTDYTQYSERSKWPERLGVEFRDGISKQDRADCFQPERPPCEPQRPTPDKHYRCDHGEDAGAQQERVKSGVKAGDFPLRFTVNRESRVFSFV